MRLTKWIVGVLLLAVLGAVIFFLRSRGRADGHASTGPEAAASADARAAPVVAVPVAERDVPIYLEGLGSVVASNTVTVKSQVDGRLDRVAFKEGQEVKKGDL